MNFLVIPRDLTDDEELVRRLAVRKQPRINQHGSCNPLVAANPGQPRGRA